MDLLRECFEEFNIVFDDYNFDLFEKYYDLLISWNSKINLTSIVDKEDVIIKHFVDSVALLSFIDISNSSLLDVGTGAGFPGLPLKILCQNCLVTLVDSLNKRISFLDEVIDTLGLTGINTVHARAEDAAHDLKFRGCFDISVSRAVAGLNVLSEYCLPFVKNNGYFISYKSGNVDDEVAKAENAVRTLGGKIERIERFCLPHSDYERSLIFIKKVTDTPDRFPRKAGVPLKKPL